MCLEQTITLLLAALSQQAHLEPVHTSLQFDVPVQIVFDGVHSDTMYVVEKKGVVRRATLEPDATRKPVYLDIQDRVGGRNDEEGLLSLAFHPRFAENGELFVWYTAQHPKRGVLSRFHANSLGGRVDSDTEQVLLEVPEPWGNHNGGTVVFGPDGYLYLGIGDGGAANDPLGHAQNRATLLGTIVRIDIDTQSKPLLYAVPRDNPFVGVDSCREEIWAWGLRNPWRMSFDRHTGELWTGDVGQNAWEEVDIVTKGGNYGWNAREGLHPFRGGEKLSSMIDPVYEYGRRSGGSITGGHVYRGADIPELNGAYVFSDYMSKRVWALFPPKEDGEAYSVQRISQKTPMAISSFGETPSGEILACGFSNPYSNSGKIYRLVSSDSDSTTSTTR